MKAVSILKKIIFVFAVSAFFSMIACSCEKCCEDEKDHIIRLEGPQEGGYLVEND